jgi:hypothetical protein
MDYELIFWLVAAAVGVIAFGAMMALAKRESEGYVDWMED